MSSWQGNILKGYFKLQRWIKSIQGAKDIPQQRADLVKMTASFKPLQPCTVQPIDAEGVPAEWLVPRAVTGEYVVLYLHGGSYHSGSPETHRSLASNLAVAAEAHALVVDYRLAPEHPFPEAIEDTMKAYHWLLSQGVTPDHIAVAGDSAGGGLSMALVLSLRDQGVPLPASVVLLSPWVDLTRTEADWGEYASQEVVLDAAGLQEAVQLYLAGTDPWQPLASPCFADLTGLPPMLIQVGSSEMLLPDARLLAQRAEEAGVSVELEIWPEMQHGWHFAPALLPEAQRAILKIGLFMKRVWSDTLLTSS